MAIEIDFLANVAKFLRGTKDAEGALDDVASSLDDVARDSKRDADKMADGFVDAAKGIARSNERLETSFAELASSAKRQTSDSARTMEQSFDRASSTSRQNLDELKNESKQNLSETLSSFDGSVEGFVAGIQGTLGGVTAGLTGVGATIIAVAGAAGLGLIFNAVQQNTLEGEKLRGKVAEITAEYIETGEVGAVSLSYIVDVMKKLATETEDGQLTLNKLAEAARNAGQPLNRIAEAYTGNSDALREVIKQNNLYRDSLDAQVLAETGTAEGFSASATAAAAKADSIDDLNSILESQLSLVVDAEEAQANYLASGAAGFEAKAKLIETVNQAYDDAAGAVDDFINAETGVLDTGAYIAAMQAKEQAIKDYQATLASSPLSAEAKAFLNEQGIESAAAFLAGYKAETPAGQAELNRIWSEAARENSGTYTNGVNAAFAGTTVRGPAVALDAPDVGSLIYNIQQDINGRRINVPVDLFYRNGVVNP